MSARADWDRIDLLFKAALEHPAEERESYLSIACPDDVRVRSEVRSLLAAHGAAGAFLETPAVRLDGDRTAASSLTLAPGDRLGAFEIVALLGAGGMGEVYRARDAQLGRDVAIKVLPPAFAADSQRLARFERESRVLASLNHPNIAAIHSVEHVDGLHLLVLELVEGLTLAERSSGGPLEIPDALAVAASCTAISNHRT
jgi:serine/threonine protein kinase